MGCRLLFHLSHSSVSPSNSSMVHLFQFMLLGPAPQFFKAKTCPLILCDRREYPGFGQALF